MPLSAHPVGLEPILRWERRAGLRIVPTCSRGHVTINIGKGDISGSQLDLSSRAAISWADHTCSALPAPR